MGQGRETSIRMINVTWNTAWIQPFESLFCILQKFSLANASTVRELQRTFGLSGKRDVPQNWSDGDRDLHGWGALDPIALSEIFQLSHDSLQTAVASTYVRDQEIKAVTSPRWRVCPVCLMTSGFHTALYQLAFVPQCPVHRIDLQTVCPSCKEPLPLYVLKKDSFTPQMGCQSCGTMWWRPSQPSSADQRECERRTSLIAESYEWLVRRKQLPAIEPNLWQLSQFGYDARGLTERVRTVLHRWADVIGSPLPDTLSMGKQPMQHHYLPITEGRNDQRTISDKEAGYLYRIFRRRLNRVVLQHHRRCITTLGQSLWWNAARREVSAGEICEYAYAYLLWRMYWERTEVPRNLFFSQARLWHEKPLVSYDWLPPDLPRLVSARLFLLECLQTYHRCLRLATRLQQERRLVFPLWQIGGTRKVEWLLKHKIQGQDMQLHWWCLSSDPKLIIVPRHPAPRRGRHSSQKLTCLAC